MTSKRARLAAARREPAPAADPDPRRRALLGAVSAVATGALLPRDAGAQFGAGDVVYVPTPQVVVNRMLAMARVGPADFVMDLGSGDGRQLITAVAKFGARGGMGFDLDEDLLKTAMANARREGVADRVRFMHGNLFDADLAQASVVTLYLLPELNLKLRPKLFAELRPGARVVSHDYAMGNWRAEESVTIQVPEKQVGTPGVSYVYLWIMPANLSGRWQWSLPDGRQAEGEIRQSLQVVDLRLALPGARAAEVSLATLRGEELRATVQVEDANGRRIRHDFLGRLRGDTLQGTVRVHDRGERTLPWKAVRTGGRAATLDPQGES